MRFPNYVNIKAYLSSDQAVSQVAAYFDAKLQVKLGKKSFFDFHVLDGSEQRCVVRVVFRWFHDVDYIIPVCYRTPFAFVVGDGWVEKRWQPKFFDYFSLLHCAQENALNVKNCAKIFEHFAPRSETWNKTKIPDKVLPHINVNLNYFGVEKLFAFESYDKNH